MKKIFLMIILSLVSILNYSFSYQVDLPTSTNDVKSQGNIDFSSSQNYYQNLASVINKYLWFFMGVVSLGMVLYAGFLLVSSNGKADDHKKANNILIWGLIGIFVSLLSYVIVKLLITLF